MKQAETNFRQLAYRGLWQQNPALVQLLGLCPLLAVSNSFVNALGLAMATLFVLTASNALISSLRRFIHQDIRLPCFVIIIAACTICVELILQAISFELYQ